MRAKRKRTQVMKHPWSLSDEWIDANILEWQRLWNDGLPHDEAMMLATSEIWEKSGCTGDNFIWLAIASLGIDPFDDVDRKRMNIDQASRRALAIVFFAKLKIDVGEARLRKRFDALVKRGEVQP